MITIEQCRAARGFLGWTQQDLADASGLSKTAINNFEKEHSDIKAESLKAIRLAFESVDIEFIGQEGVRRQSEHAELLKGPQMYNHLLDDVLSCLNKQKGELLVVNADEDMLKLITPEVFQDYLDRLRRHDIKTRILYPQGARTLLNTGNKPRFLSCSLAKCLPTKFIYDTKVAVEFWEESMIGIVTSHNTSNAERRGFEILWDEAPEGNTAEKNDATDFGH